MLVFSGNFAVRIIGFLSSIVIVRLIDKVSYAHYTYANNLLSYVSLISGLGLYTALLKSCATTTSAAYDKAYLLFGVRISVIFDLVLAALLVAIASTMDLAFAEAKGIIYALAIMPLLQDLLYFVQMYNRAHQRIKTYASIGIAQAMLLLVFGAGLSYLCGVYGMVIARYVSVFIAMCVGLRFIFGNTKNVTAQVLTNNEKKAYLYMAVMMMTTTMFSLLMPINEMFLVNTILKNVNTTANFKVAGLIPEQLLLIPSSIAVYYFPILSKITDQKVIFSKMLHIGILTLCIVAIATVLGILLTPLIIRVVYGEQYLDAQQLSGVLWIMRATNAGIRLIPVALFPAIGHIKFNMVAMILTCVVQSTLDYYLISTIGIVGIAYASICINLIAGFCYWGYLYYTCHRRLQVSA